MRRSIRTRNCLQQEQTSPTPGDQIPFVWSVLPPRIGPPFLRRWYSRYASDNCDTLLSQSVSSAVCRIVRRILPVGPESGGLSEVQSDFPPQIFRVICRCEFRIGRERDKRLYKQFPPSQIIPCSICNHNSGFLFRSCHG